MLAFQCFMHIGAFVPLLMQSYATFGYEAFYGPASFVSNICQGAASLAIAVKTKSKATRQLTISTGISALLGITEPALYGVTIKNRKVLFAVMAGGGIGGLYAGLNHVVRYAPGAPGLATFALFIGEDPMVSARSSSRVRMRSSTSATGRLCLCKKVSSKVRISLRAI